MSAAKERDDFWDLPPLSPEDQRLLNAYERTGTPLDKLPYSPQFEQLMTVLGKTDQTEEKYLTFQRLLQLRKQGRLPRLGRSSAESF